MSKYIFVTNIFKYSNIFVTLWCVLTHGHASTWKIWEKPLNFMWAFNPIIYKLCLIICFLLKHLVVFFNVTRKSFDSFFRANGCWVNKWNCKIINKVNFWWTPEGEAPLKNVLSRSNLYGVVYSLAMWKILLLNANLEKKWELWYWSFRSEGRKKFKWLVFNEVQQVFFYFENKLRNNNWNGRIIELRPLW